ncbi:M1 family metallopeptidase [Winogradskyella sp. A3E31]|uniref:M1 family metallopeptidase n=1 Tax=Winogradskyella sp. A3E31 TaxID=3349637 RepID=UPI00398ABE00
MKQLFIAFSLFFSIFSFSQQTDNVDFLRLEASISFYPDSSKVYGSGKYSFKILRPVDSVYIDAKGFKLDTTIPDWVNNGLNYSYDGKKIWIKGDFNTGETYEFNFEYEVIPKKALYFLKRGGDWNIWTQGQGKYTSNWLPSFDDVNEKVVFNLAFLYRPDYTVLSNGSFNKRFDKHLAQNVFVFNMEKPMSSYLVALALGRYNKKTETSKSGIPLEYYYYLEDSLKVESTYRYSKQMFDFLEEEIGFPYPWQNYKQVPVHDFLYAGMENTTLTIFSDAYMVDEIGFNDKNYINVNAHELAHQWFGDLVTATSGEHHWLQEGFATYYALLAEKDIFGEDHYHFKLYQTAQELGRQDDAGQATSLLNPTSSSLTFYQRGAWVLHALREKVRDSVFKPAVLNYLNAHQFDNVETHDFISEVEALYGESLDAFVDKWIVAKPFPFDDAIQLLKSKSSFIHEYAMVDCEAKDSKCSEYLSYPISDEAKVKIIAQAPSLVDNETFRNSVKVRQAISQYVTKIPQSIKANYETLLDDKSYITIESALYNLWLNFPEERSKYLSKTQDVIGFNDYNVRLLWLVLSLNTLEYQSEKTEELFNDLVGYTDSKHNFELRMNAFRYLELLKACDLDCKSNLEQAKSHHNWRMVNFAKDMQERLKQND